MDNMNLESVLSLVASSTGVKLKDLVSATEGQEYTSIEEIQKAITPVVQNHTNELTKKHFRKGVSKAERTIKEVFPDLEGTKVEDIVTELQDKVNKPTKEVKTEIKEKDIIKFLHSEQGKEYVSKSNEEYAAAKISNLEFENKLIQKAVLEIESKGGKFSTNERIRARQIKMLKQDLLDSHKFTEKDGNFIPIDDDNEQLIEGNKIIEFQELAVKYSPVDFQTDTTPTVNQPKTPTVKAVKDGTPTSNFGYTSDELKQLNYKDFYEAKQQGDFERSGFIQKQMILNEEQNNE